MMSGNSVVWCSVWRSLLAGGLIFHEWNSPVTDLRDGEQLYFISIANHDLTQFIIINPFVDSCSANNDIRGLLRLIKLRIKLGGGMNGRLYSYLFTWSFAFLMRSIDRSVGRSSVNLRLFVMYEWGTHSDMGMTPHTVIANMRICSAQLLILWQ